MKTKTRKNIFITLLGFIFTIVLFSCEEKNKVYEWRWDKKDSIPVSTKPRFIWISSGANFNDFANSKENILRDLTLAKESGFTDIVVDVRPTGDVLFKTDKVKQVQWLGAWKDGAYVRIDRTATWDYLQAFIDAGHSLGLKIHAGVNTFIAGQKNQLGELGLLYEDPTKKEWATQLLTSNGIINVMDQNATGGKFLNPAHEAAQDYIVDMLGDLAANYPSLDGIILDRGRFEGLMSDFSPYTREKFEAYLGQKVVNFPEDIMNPNIKEGSLPSVLPVHFKKWLEFRVKVIHDFMAKAQGRVKEKNPDVKFGVYVGGWYATYYGTGVNWASKTYNTASEFPQWATGNYKDYGYADLMDIILIGAYASYDRVIGTTEWTIQGFCSRAKAKIKDDALVAGGPDIGNGNWASNDNIPAYNQAIVKSVKAVMDVCDGYFLFDMIHLKNRNQWIYAKHGIELLSPEITIVDGVLLKWTGASGDIVIPESVTSVADGVFQDNIFITSVSGENVTAIGAQAFENCNNVLSYNFPNLVNVGRRAFRGNSKLQSIDISKVTSIDEAFHSCSALTTVTAPLLTTIGNYSFYNCTSLVSVNFPEVQTIGTGSFQGCSKLITVSLDKVESIGQDAFRSSKLTTPTFPSLTTLGKSAFQTVSTLTSFTAPNLETVGESSFHTTSLQNVSFPKVKSIGNYGFFNNTSLIEAFFPVIETIGTGAFSAQSALIASMTLKKVYLNAATNLSSVAADAFIKTKTDLTIYVHSADKVALFPADRQYQVVVDSITNDLDIANTHFSIYPNPTNKTMYISVNDIKLGEKIRLLDLNGRQLLVQPISNLIEKIDVNFLNSGVYILNIGNRNTKLIVR